MSSSEVMNASSFRVLMATCSLRWGPSSMHRALYTLANVPCVGVVQAGVGCVCVGGGVCVQLGCSDAFHSTAQYDAQPTPPHAPVNAAFV